MAEVIKIVFNNYEALTHHFKVKMPNIQWKCFQNSGHSVEQDASIGLHFTVANFPAITALESDLGQIQKAKLKINPLKFGFVESLHHTAIVK